MRVSVAFSLCDLRWGVDERFYPLAAHSSTDRGGFPWYTSPTRNDIKGNPGSWSHASADKALGCLAGMVGGMVDAAAATRNL